MSNIRLRRLCLTAILAALGCAMTFVHIPYPLGYLNLGDCVVLLASVILPPGYAMAAAGIAGATADLFLGYSLYAPATLVIKALMAGLCGCIYKRKQRFLPALWGSICAELWMVLGYFLYESLLYSVAAAGESALAINLPQGAVNTVLFLGLWLAMKRSKLLEKTRRQINYV